MTKLRRRVLQLVNKYQHLMGLDHWDIQVQFVPLTVGPARVQLTAAIREAVLQFDLERMKHRPARMIEHDVIHELGHLRMARYDALLRVVWEHLVKTVEEDAAVDFERMPALNRGGKCGQR